MGTRRGLLAEGESEPLGHKVSVRPTDLGGGPAALHWHCQG